MRSRKSDKIIDIREISPSIESGISVCMIARDEAPCIADALYSVKNLAEEMIVVDTGSQDETVQLAEQCGARVYRIAWKEDFSEARNFALSKAAYNWVLILDADEVISREDVSRIRDLARSRREIAFSFEQRTYLTEGGDLGCEPVIENDCMSRGFAFFKERQIRFFPNRPFIRYSCEIHESPEPSILSSGIPIENACITVHHYGRLSGTDRASRKARLWRAMGREALEAFPAHPFYLYEMAVQFLSQGSLDAAARHLDMALEIDRRSSRLWNAYGMVRMSAGDRLGALDCFKRALSLAGEDARILNNIGVALMKGKEYAEALIWLEKGVNLDEQDADLLRNAAAACAAIGEFERGCEYLERSLAIEPFSAGSYVVQAELLLGKGDRDGAERALEKIRFLPRVPLDVSLKMIKIYVALHRTREAEELALSTLRSFPGIAEIPYLAGKIAESRGDDERAEILYKKALSERPYDAEVLASLGCLYDRKGRLSEALAAFKEALRASPGNGRYEVNLGIVLDKLGMAKEAQRCFETALAKGETSAFAYNAIGCHHARYSRYEKAIECFERAVDLEPENAAYYRNLALACERTNFIDMAVRAYERVAELDPSMASYARERLSRLLCISQALQVSR